MVGNFLNLIKTKGTSTRTMTKTTPNHIIVNLMKTIWFSLQVEKATHTEKQNINTEFYSQEKYLYTIEQNHFPACKSEDSTNSRTAPQVMFKDVIRQKENSTKKKCDLHKGVKSTVSRKVCDYVRRFSPLRSL
jgi:hypothetical protein